MIKKQYFENNIVFFDIGQRNVAIINIFLQCNSHKRLKREK